MLYAGFWLRLIAMFIDGMVFMPIALIYLYTRAISWDIAIGISIPYCFSYALYNVYFHGRWGGTVGKLLIRIKVVTLEGKDINYTRACLRHGVDLGLAVLSSIAFTMALLTAQNTETTLDGWKQLNAIFHVSLPLWWNWIKAGSNTWIFSELVTLLTNNKKRSIHDFIAGTVVIRTDL